MLNDNQKQELKELEEKLGKHIAVSLSTPNEDHQLFKEMQVFVRELADCCDRVEVGNSSIGGSYPRIEIGSGKRCISYETLPIEGEWRPFVSAICMICDIEESLTKTQASRLSAISGPVSIEVYVTPQCPFCAMVVDGINRIALSSSFIETTIVDASQFLERAANIGIRSTPTVVIDGKSRWVGRAKLDDLLSLFEPEDAAWSSMLKSCIASAEIDQAVEAIVSNPEAAPALGPLLTEPELSFHMGVLRVLEDSIERDERLAPPMLAPLANLLGHKNPQTRGNAAYAIGLLGLAEGIEHLLAHQDDKDEEVRETIEEALEMLQSP